MKFLITVAALWFKSVFGHTPRNKSILEIFFIQKKVSRDPLSDKCTRNTKRATFDESLCNRSLKKNEDDVDSTCLMNESSLTAEIESLEHLQLMLKLKMLKNDLNGNILV